MGTAHQPPPDHGDSYSLLELSGLTGIEPRTIRSYVERGLIQGPDSLGRGVRYSREALDRLRVVLLLRDAKRDITLDQLRVLLQSLSPAHIHGIATGAIRIGGLIDTDAQPTNPTAPASVDDALSYLRSLRNAGGTSPGQHVAEAGASYSHAPQNDADLSVLANAAQALTALAGLSSNARSVRAEAWYRISLTPEIELNVRGQYGPEELAQLHRIGDALRVLLTKGAAR